MTFYESLRQYLPSGQHTASCSAVQRSSRSTARASSPDARFKFWQPETDETVRNIVRAGAGMGDIGRHELLGDLPFELDAMGTGLATAQSPAVSFNPNL